MTRALAWLRWEFGRRIELTTGLKLIVLDRSVKAVFLVLAGIALLVADSSGFLVSITTHVTRELNLTSGSHLWLRLVNYVLQHLGALSSGARTALAVAVILYGLLEAGEAIGLLLRRRWAEYLVLLATVAFIPVEIDELLRHPSIWKGVAFAINVAIVVYLVRRKRLFLDRPQALPATRSPAPAGG